MTQVNLFVVGAMKSGSTTLHEYLERHPAIYMSPEKEPGYFVPELWKGRTDQEYNALFEGADSATYRGESSTHYTKLPTYTGVAERIHHYNNDARILYIMRDPIKRLFSHYRHAVRDLHFYGETRTIMRAIEKDPMYLGYSDYAMQLEPYFRLFGADRVYTLTFEELISNAEEVMSDIFDWMEIDSDVPIGDTIAANQAPERFKKARGRGLLNRVRHSRTWDSLSGAVPKQLREWGADMSETEATEVLSMEEMAAVRTRFRDYFRERVGSLSQLTGKTYQQWEL
ncbi:hypothetical protein CLH62_01800 [Marinobacter guineae]|uniref:Sulfotransferase n=1 Tax=Marinobacter guineae TaxID=432303 RepID=A0A2G1VHU8_9GAMM|nr:sulfotransferase [Marinobacter guineae]PHQ26357.1 hypothetical protein CLH62_01800 [Marinobacter guineae]